MRFQYWTRGVIPPEEVSTLVAILAGGSDEGVAEGRLVWRASAEP